MLAYEPHRIATRDYIPFALASALARIALALPVRVCVLPWAATLYVDDIVVVECVVDNLTGMFRVAERWRVAVKTDETGVRLAEMLRAETDPPHRRPQLRLVAPDRDRVADRRR